MAKIAPARRRAIAAQERKVTPRTLMGDREFRNSSFHDQDARLSKLDPEGFGAQSEADKRELIQFGLERVQPSSDFGMATWSGVMQHYSGFSHRMANMVSMLPDDLPIGAVPRRGSPLPPGMPATATAGELSEYLRETSDRAAEEGQLPEDATDVEKLASIAGTLPGSLAEVGAYITAAGTSLPAALVHRLAPPLGIAAMGIMDTTDQDWEAMAKAGGEGFFLGALFPLTQHMSRFMKAAILGGVAYGMTPEEMDPTLRIGHGATMAILSGARGRRPIDSLLAKTRIPVLSKDYYRMKFNRKKMALEEDLQKQVELEKLKREGEEPLPEGLRDQETTEGGPQTERLPQTKPGANYRDVERISVSEKTPEAVIRGRDVITKLAKKLDIPLDAREGGEFYFRQPREGELLPSGEPRHRFVDESTSVQDFVAADKVATELGHAVGEHTKLGKKMGMREREAGVEVPAWEQEIRALSPDATSTSQGFAEFMRHWLTRTNENAFEPGKHYATDTTYLEATAPKALARFKEVLLRYLPAKQRNALQAARREISQWYEEGPLTALRGVTSKEKHPLLPMMESLSRSREYFMDDLEGIRQLDIALGREPSESAWRDASLTHGIPNAAEAMATNGHPAYIVDPNGGMKVRYAGKSIFKILDPIYRGGKKKVEPFDLYSIARSAEELIGQTVGEGGKIRPSTAFERLDGLTREKLVDERMIKAGKALETPEFRKAFDELVEFNSKVLDFAEATGSLDPADRANFKRSQYAFGMHRDMTTGKRGLGGTSDQLSANLGINSTHGSKRLLLDNFHNLISGSSKIVAAAKHNLSRLEIVDGAIEGKADNFLTREKPTSERIQVGRKGILEAFEREAARIGETDAAGGRQMMEWLGNAPEALDRLSLFLGANKPYGSDIMTVFRKGKPEYYRIHDPMLERAIQALNRPSLSSLFKTFNWMKRVKQGYIVLSPDFMVANFVRDALMSSIMTRTGNQHLTASLNGLRNVIFNTEGYKDFVANNGGGSTMRGGTDITRKAMKRYSERRSPGSLFLGAPKDVVPFLRSVGNAMENAARVGEFQRAQRPETRYSKAMGFTRGATAKQAAFMGKEISVDFSRRGLGHDVGADRGVLNFLNASVPFFSSMVASSDRMYRSVMTDPSAKMNTAVKIGLLAANSIALQELNRWQQAKYGHLLNEEGHPYIGFDRLEDWEKAGYWNFWIPTQFSMETGEPVAFQHGKVAKLWEAGMIGTIAEMTVQAMHDGNQFDSDFAAAIAQVTAHNFNLNIVGESFPVPLPAGVDLLVEQSANKVLFTGQPIESRRDEGVAPWLRAGPSTPKSLQALAYGLRLAPDVPGISTLKSPKRAEAAMRNIFSRWGPDTINAVEAFMEGTMRTLGTMGYEMMDPEIFAKNTVEPMSRKPILRRFISEPGQRDRNVSEYYDMREQFQMAHNTWKNLLATGNNKRLKEQLEEFELDPDQMASAMLHPGHARAGKAVDNIQTEILQIKQGVLMQDATREERTKKLSELRAERNALMKSLNEEFREDKEKEEAKIRAKGRE